MPGKKRPLTIWLVHGTWARNAQWTRDDSPFRVGLQRCIEDPIRFERFQWTANNQRLDREAAAEALVSAASEIQDVDGQRFIVAHSHGGNIAVRAVQRAPRLFAGVVTLNTPFLITMPRELGIVALQIVLLVLGATMLLGVLPLGALTINAIRVAFLATVAGLLYLCRDWLKALIESADRELLKDRAVHSTTRVFCISTADDEAFGWLEAIETIINAPYLLLHKIGLGLSLLAIGCAHYLFSWDFAAPALELSPVFEWIALLAARAVGVLEPEKFAAYIWTGSGTAPFAMLGVSTLFYFVTFWSTLAGASVAAVFLVRGIAFGRGFGLEALFMALVSRIKVSLTPSQIANSEIAFIHRLGDGVLRHSDIHANWKTPELIAGWFAFHYRRKGKSLNEYAFQLRRASDLIEADQGSTVKRTE